MPPLTQLLTALLPARSRRPRPHDQRGASSVEYALLLAGITAVIVAVVLAMGPTVAGLFDVDWPIGGEDGGAPGGVEMRQQQR